MGDPTQRGDDTVRLRLVCRIAVAAVLLGVFVTWVADGPVRLDGTQGPNNGWLAAILAWLDARAILGASAAPGLLLVLAGSAVLTAVSLVRAVELARGALRQREASRAA